MKRSLRNKLFAWIGGLFVLQFLVHGLLLANQWVDNYAPAAKGGKSQITSGLSPDQIMLELFGFREFLAGILWVRADGFFDQGDYDAVLPIIRLCTILDPKDIDVYATGMWHIAYNFTDTEQRSDRRYIAPAVALGKEGCANNPETYELFFETGWLWFHKIDDDYYQAVDWFGKANQHDDIQTARRNMLAHALERNDQPDRELNTFYDNIDFAKKDMHDSAGHPIPQASATLDTINDNVDNTIIRMAQRGWLAEQRDKQNGTHDYDTGNYDTKPPFDVGFSGKVTVEDPKVIRFQGTWNVLPVGTRVRAIVRDETIMDPSGKERIDLPGEMKWDYASGVNLDPSKDVTYMQEQCFVKNRHFDKRVDLSKDPTMYPFSPSQKRFVVEFFYDPRSAPSHIQDKFGFNGEGMTDKHYMNSEIRPGHSVLYAKLYLTRDQVLRRGEWENKVPTVETAGYNDAAAAATDNRIITLSGSLLSQAQNQGSAAPQSKPAVKPPAKK